MSAEYRPATEYRGGLPPTPQPILLKDGTKLEHLIPVRVQEVWLLRRPTIVFDCFSPDETSLIALDARLILGLDVVPAPEGFGYKLALKFTYLKPNSVDGDYSEPEPRLIIPQKMFFGIQAAHENLGERRADYYIQGEDTRYPHGTLRQFPLWRTGAYGLPATLIGLFGHKHPQLNNRGWADRQFLGDTGDYYFRLSDRERALTMATSEGCPVAVSLTEDKSKGGKGALEMELRYGTVNFWYGIIVELLEKAERFDIINEMKVPQKRRENIGQHDLGWAPTALYEYQYVSAVGYHLPRLVLEYIESKDNAITDVQLRALRVLELIDNVIKKNPAGEADLLVSLGEIIARQISVDENDRYAGKRVLRRIISRDKLAEDNCHTEYVRIAKAMKTKPHLRELYSALSPHWREQMGIADLPEIPYQGI